MKPSSARPRCVNTRSCNVEVAETQPSTTPSPISDPHPRGEQGVRDVDAGGFPAHRLYQLHVSEQSEAGTSWRDVDNLQGPARVATRRSATCSVTDDRAN